MIEVLVTGIVCTTVVASILAIGLVGKWWRL
jgi:hypothetical protein